MSEEQNPSNVVALPNRRPWSEPEKVTFLMRVVFHVRLVLMLLWLVFSSLVALPLALVRWKNPSNNRLFGDIYGPVARKILSIETEVEGWEHMTAHQPCIFVVNHQSGADMAILEQVYPKRTLLIGKKELLYIPVWGLMYVAFGNILINRQNRHQAVSGLNVAVDTLKRRGLSIFIFPEGTRNASGIGLLPFKKGAFHMAIAAQVPIVPVVCSSLAKVINFQRRYARPGKIYVRALPPIQTAGKTSKQIEAVMNETRDQMIAALAELNARP